MKRLVRAGTAILMSACLALTACSSEDTSAVEEDLASPVTDFLNDTPFYVSHRLGGGEYPEMTESGMQASIDLGFKGFEYSVYRTRDGVYVGSHDWTTERTAGVRHEIWDTDWSTIQQLDQPAGKFTRLEQIVDMMPSDGVLVLDHKTTSAVETANDDDMTSEAELFTLLESLFENPTERVIWKVFNDASSAERARDKGYMVMAMLYENEVAQADFDRWDIIGMEHNASESAWNTVTTHNKPTIAHIVKNQEQAKHAIDNGADGIMSTMPSDVGPRQE